ncbi:MAG: nucleoside triphosphate pyrophosphohydrolase [Candidatus Hydrothermales bacterium]
MEKNFKEIIQKEKNIYQKLSKLVEILRENCPWDKKQTLFSYRRELLEECYELISAINFKDKDKIKEEMGDLVLTIFMMLDALEKEKVEKKEKVIEHVIDKMIKKHPHVFGEEELTEEEFLKKWELEKKEKGLKVEDKVFPSLLLAEKLSKRAGRMGFDWENVEDVIEKLKEEIEEFKKAIKRNNKEEIEEELGDILFVITNIGRHLGISAEIALNKVNEKFIKRFNEMISISEKEGKEFHTLTLKEMDTLWEKAKNKIKKKGENHE